MTIGDRCPECQESLNITPYEVGDLSQLTAKGGKLSNRREQRTHAKCPNGHCWEYIPARGHTDWIRLPDER